MSDHELRVGDKIRIKVPSEASRVFDELVGEVFTIRGIYPPMFGGAGRWITLEDTWLSGLHERDTELVAWPCPMDHGHV